VLNIRNYTTGFLLFIGIVVMAVILTFATIVVLAAIAAIMESEDDFFISLFVLGLIVFYTIMLYRWIG